MGDISLYFPELWFAGIMKHLQQELSLTKVAWSEPQETLKKKGDTVNIQLPSTFVAKEKTSGGDVTVQSVNPTNVALVLDQHYEVTYQIEDADAAKSLQALDKIYMGPAAEALAFKIETDGMAELYSQIRLAYGTAGTTPSTFASITQANSILNKLNVPKKDRAMIVNSDAWAALAGNKDIYGLDATNKAGIFNNGILPNMADTQMLVSNYVDSVLNLGFGAGPFSIDSGGGYPVGTTTIHVKGFDAAVLTPGVKAGQIISLTSAGVSKQYTVTADADIDGAGDADLVIFPALEDAATDGDVFTFITGAEDTTFARNILLQPQAITFASAPMTDMESPGVLKYTDTIDDIAMTIVIGYDKKKLAKEFTIHCLYGWQSVRPDFATLVLG